MIKFFRRIRQRLVTENKVSKYILYAIGEIALVMIGILLALQVNNWNEQNANQELEKDLLLGLQSDLIQDTLQINNRFYKSYIDLKKSISLFDSVLVLKGTDHTIKLLDSLFERCTRQRNTFWPGSGTYKSIVNNGTSNLFRNKDLYKGIQNLYDKTYEIIINAGIRIDDFSDNLRYNFNYVKAMNIKDRLAFYKDSRTRNELEYWNSQMENFNGLIDYANQLITTNLIAIENEINTFH